MTDGTIALLILLGVGVIVLVLGWAFGRIKRKTERSPAHEDAEDLRKLARAGVDLSQPVAVGLVFYLPSETAARQAAVRLGRSGDPVEVDGPERGMQWTCVVTRRLVLSVATLAAERERLLAIVAPLGGTYDGWDTP